MENGNTVAVFCCRLCGFGFLVFRGIRSYVGYTNELFGVRNHKTLGSAIEFQ